MSEAFRRDSDINNWDQLERFAEEISTAALAQTNPDLNDYDRKVWTDHYQTDKLASPEFRAVVTKLL
jgi:hypothetical protein